MLDVWKQNSNCLFGDFGKFFAMKIRIGIAGQLQISRESVGFCKVYLWSQGGIWMLGDRSASAGWLDGD